MLNTGGHTNAPNAALVWNVKCEWTMEAPTTDHSYINYAEPTIVAAFSHLVPVTSSDVLFMRRANRRASRIML